MHYLERIKTQCKQLMDFEGRKKKRYALLEEQASQGDENAIYKLIALYYDRNKAWHPTAFKWALIQAKKGSDCGVLFQVAKMYDEGEGTDKDEFQALTWYERTLSLHILQGKHSSLSVEVTNYVQLRIKALREKLGWNN